LPKGVIEFASHELLWRSGDSDLFPEVRPTFHALPKVLQERIQRRIDELGLNLRDFQHRRLQGVEAFKLRAGDYRVIYEFNVDRNELFLLTVGNRRDIYKKTFN
jgi:mRNA interferase RelE/StbE